MMEEAKLFNRLKALIGFRVLFVTVLLGSFFIFQIGYGVLSYHFSILYLIILLYLLSIAYSVALGRVRGLPLAYAQLFLDVLCASALILMTGGIDSWFSWLLLLIVVSAAMVINKRAGYVVATFAGLLYGTLIDLQYYGVIPVHYDPNLMEKDFLYKIFSHFSGLYLIAYLTGRLTSSLESRDTDVEDLTLFSRGVIESTPSGLFTTTPDGRVKLFNRAAEKITGIGRAAAIGRNVREIFPFIKSIGEQTRTEAAVRFNGEEKIIGFTVSALQDSRGREAGFISVFQDLTELRKMSEEIKKKEKLAAVGELSANIAHEIRNPLASLKGSIEMLREDSLQPAQRDRLMGIALSEMDRLNTIITDFLEYSKPGEPEMKDCDLHAALEETVEMLKHRGVSGVSFRKGFDGPLLINADPSKLQQVFWNLGINALDAMPDGGELSVKTERGDGAVMISFRDTGAGISRETVDKIFFPFFTTKGNGTGLGLSIAYRIVEDHGGRIAVRSAPGEGAEFKIYLPGGA